MKPTLGNESGSVQNPLIQYATEVGWELVAPAEAVKLRRGEAGTMFYALLEETLLKLNPGIVTTENVGEIVRRIEGVRNSIEGNAEILAWLRGERSVYVASEKRQRNVRLIDYEKLNQNTFQVTGEWQYTNGMQSNRADVMFLINGLPVALVETKSARRRNGVEEALTQVRRYHRETPEMLTAPQVFDLTHLIDFYYGATWSLDRKNLFNWKDEESGNFERKVKRFFDRGRFLTMLREWILFYVKDDELQKTVLRQHQTRAVEKVLQRCADPKKQTGLVWHTQGSGKTFTMITAARLLLEDKETFGKPTVLLIIDRNELEGQLTGWVERLLGELVSKDIAIEHANSKKRLRELLASDFRGLIVSMIHKFDGIPQGVNKRDNVFVLIDEAHRSTGGDLGNYLMAALPNATLIGFTGTPIDKTAYGQGTFKVFGKQDEEGYLDKYSIGESMADGTTLRLKYALAPNDIRLPEELLEKEFLALAEAEGVSDVDELNRILDKAVTLKAFLKSEKRVKAVAEFVADHFRTNVQPLGYKAFLVAVDREACALYKQALDKLLAPESVVPIYTPAQNDSERLPLVAKYQTSETDEKTARKTFIKPGLNPQILVVTDKLLTGYDAPILYCMYLDKPMRDHVLLQAIARVNRPYEEEGSIKKPCGFVLDYIGIFSKLKKALAFDSKEVSGIIENIDVLFARFKDLMADKASDYLPLIGGAMDDKAVERTIDAFADKNRREEFYAFFKEVETLYEILSPSPELRDFIEPFAKLAALYEIVRNAFEVKTPLYADVAKKTEHLVRENAATYGLTKTTTAVEINEKTLKAIQARESSDTSKVINLVKALVKAAQDKGNEEPYLIPISERAEAIMEEFDDRQKSTRDALADLARLAQEKIEAEKERERTGMDINTFTIYWELRGEAVPNSQAVAAAINEVIQRFPNFQFNPEELRQLKAEVYRLLLTVVDGKKMVALTERLLKLNRK
jgi:type I restriction enzyme R subunit